MEKVNLTINGIAVSVPSDYTILQAAHEVGINIPTLCYLKDINEIGACRMCVVEVKGARSYAAACVQPVGEGMEVVTNSPKLLKARKTNLELLLSTHERKCLSCIRSGNCELQNLCTEYGVEDETKYEGENIKYPIDDSAIHMYRDNNKCILCRRCSAACRENQAVAVIGPNDRGHGTHIACAFESPLGETNCINCGQCIVVCPTGALGEKDETEKVLAAIADPDKHVIVQTAPSIRVALGEAFGLPLGTNVQGKMVSALRRMGFDSVFDTDFGADLTVMEEAHEFLDRFKNGGKLPLITSCSPGWVKYCEHFFPDFIPNLSSCKSPQQMFGAIAKSYYAEMKGIDPKDIVSVSIMPCTAKKFEVDRHNQDANGIPDVDVALTTRELARMIKRCGLSFNDLPEEDFDHPLGESSGAGVIFGASGGVMEAALRTAVESITNQKLDKLELTEVRGMEGIKEAVFHIEGQEIKVAICSGTKNAAELLTNIRNGKANYHFIEIMACPGGCINGGGQPIQVSSLRNFTDIRTLRAKTIYEIDVNSPVRKAHENPSIMKLYTDFLGEPGGHKAHELLHTTYQERDLY